MSVKDEWTDAMRALREPFDPREIEWRPQQVGIGRNGRPYIRVLAYITNRAIMYRLDDVFGIGGWQSKFNDIPDGGVECGIGCSLDGDHWVWKWDAADKTDIEAIKGGRSSAMKRAAVHWGIARYLYYLESGFGNIREGGSHWQPAGSNPKRGWRWDGFAWDPPELPDFALPKKKEEVEDIVF